MQSEVNRYAATQGMVLLIHAKALTIESCESIYHLFFTTSRRTYSNHCGCCYNTVPFASDGSILPASVRAVYIMTNDPDR